MKNFSLWLICNKKIPNHLKTSNSWLAGNGNLSNSFSRQNTTRFLYSHIELQIQTIFCSNVSSNKTFKNNVHCTSENMTSLMGFAFVRSRKLSVFILPSKYFVKKISTEDINQKSVRIT